MQVTPDDFSRVGKLFVDRDGTQPEEVRERLSKYQVALACGPEVAESPTLQAAVLTAANVADRCFPGAVSYHPSAGMNDDCLLLPWPHTRSLSAAILDVAPRAAVGSREDRCQACNHVAFGTRSDCNEGLQVTFDGWSAAVVPLKERLRLPEREMCILSGVVAGALAICELFLSFAEVTISASRRRVGISLWRPDLAWDDPMAAGVPIEFVPNEFWSLGLGHLGQAYLWCLGLLPYTDPSTVNIILNDFDLTVPANMDTGILTKAPDVGRLKTRVADAWLREKGFRPRLVERAFDEGVRCKAGDPAVALCGFDVQGPRSLLDNAGYQYVVECGLGGRADNFDDISVNTLPNPARRSAEIWPADLAANSDDRKRVTALGESNAFYRSVREKYGCGHVQLAEKAVAVPFVGAVAAGLALADVLRTLHEGTRYEAVNLRLECPDLVRTHVRSSNDSNMAPPHIAYQRVAPKAMYRG